MTTRRIISVLMENESGALARVVGLFAQRGYNIDSLTVAPTEDATLSRMTLVTQASDQVIEQITKQLHKLIEVVKLIDLSEGVHVERELLLVKVRAAGAQREEVKRTADIFRGQVIDVTPNTYTIQVAGNSDKLDAFLGALAQASVLEVVRSGVSGISRGEKTLSL
ncbi:acetolactate synthase small subunit [Natronospirillum operosum]|uniref:Acetolactate synthase small subunit n=1 Tax=Natronospirillum operosum TaxID=2759953 RepID=A0A4Z0W565_9GAMM|nr:acetolactate synthase small subunit [Natronospirillum operosum]TGG91997.1 acetolactate synthase small subunit [Natronospirillum operosum]